MGMWRTRWRRFARSQPQHLVGDFQSGPGRCDIQIAAFDRHAVGGLTDGNGARPGKDLSGVTVVLRIEVVNQYECHARVCR